MAPTNNRLVAYLMLILLISSVSTPAVEAGPFGVGICYAGCAGLMVACCSAAGVVFGTAAFVAMLAVSPVLAACNVKFAMCYKMCTVAALAPVP